ncbi:hypothetical protein SAMN04488082_114102 [Desulfomicrobium apsheronum]|uniref:Methyl-accepting chemotaxis protein n=1 Tax=Desulfomicrobium apsheronum TaxID=52560 RepID=A0A1I3WWP5_9BACT|nr:hypothetical protein [Desulfomicrobium apsheronum]SFK11938.1 hypothetical protein SAMN04488082_114102 [Desulfomicrobium apsheronum]
MKTQFELSGFPVPELLMDAELDLVNQDGGTGRHDQEDISDNVNQDARGIAEINSNVTSSSAMTQEISDEIEGVRDSSNAMQDESRMVLRSAGGLADLFSHLEKLVGRFRF